MRPYLAVIKDSFREAFATRVLWFVLVCITLFLLAVAPVGYDMAKAVSLQVKDFRDPGEFVTQLGSQREDTSTPAGYVWSQLTEDLRSEVGRITPQTSRLERINAFQRIRGELNEMLKRSDFYDEEVWKDVRLNDEAKELKERGIDGLDGDEVARLNRLAFDAAFHEHIVAVPTESVSIFYLVWRYPEEIPLTQTELQETVRMIVAGLIEVLVGVIGIFTAIVVTAWIVPRMLDAGAIDLLLSKPVSRSFLFLSKFFGGCAFIFLNTAYMIVGLWLIVGLRFDVWSTGLLWTIPVFVFVFAIYYSISTFAAVIWRNAIVSIVVSILFWAACFAVGTTKHTMDQLFLNGRRTAAIIPAGDSLLRTNNQATGYEWNPDSGSWSLVFEPEQKMPAGIALPNPYIGPIYDATHDRLVAIRVPLRMGWLQGSSKLVVATPKDDWKPQEGISTPPGTKSLMIDSNGGVIVAGVSGFYRFEGDPTESGSSVEVFGLKVPLGGDADFERIDEKDDFPWMEPFDAALNVKDEKFAVVSGDKIAVLAKNDQEKWEVSRRVDRENTDPAVIAFAGSHVLVASQSGTIDVLDAATLESQQQLTPFRTNQPQLIRTSPDGRWVAVLFHHKKLWLFDAKTAEPASAWIAGQGDITAVAFDQNNTVYVGDRFGRIIQYNPANSFHEVRQFTPELELSETIYLWGVSPLYTVFPKPGEMDNLVTSLLTERETIAMEESKDLNAQHVVLDIWTPVWSNLAFLAVMLALTCVIVVRKDF